MEQRRSLPVDLWQALYRAGLFHFTLPRDVGGFEAPLPDTLKILEAIAAIDASTAWNVAIGAGTATLGSMMQPEEARATIWSQPLGVAVGTLTVLGRADVAGDHYLVSGRWPFSSGCIGATWYLAACNVFDDDEPRLDSQGNRVTVILPIPMSDCRIDETWDSAGLRGTGSHHVAIEGSRVRVEQGFTLFGATFPGTPLHQLPIMALLNSYLTAIMCGVVEGAFNEVFELIGERSAQKGGLDSFPSSIALQIAELLAEAKAWRADLFSAAEELWQEVLAAREDDGARPPDDFAVRLASLGAARRGPKLVSDITVLAGGRALTDAPGLQRRLRDSHAIASHGQYATPLFAKLGHEAVVRGVASHAS